MELISYALDFASFLIQNIKNKGDIKSIILFGSVARDEADNKSDVDLFVDLFNRDTGNEKNAEKINKEVEKIRDNFFDSVKFKKYWALYDVKNEINVIVGKIDEWKLKDSMLGSSIVLYQKYTPNLEKGKSRVVISWGNIKPDSKRVMVSKKIFGYNHYGTNYSGILSKYNGRKLGANVIILDIEGLNETVKIFRKFKVSIKIHRFFEYE